MGFCDSIARDLTHLKGDWFLRFVGLWKRKLIIGLSLREEEEEGEGDEIEKAVAMQVEEEE